MFSPQTMFPPWMTPGDFAASRQVLPQACPQTMLWPLGPPRDPHVTFRENALADGVMRPPVTSQLPHSKRRLHVACSG